MGNYREIEEGRESGCTMHGEEGKGMECRLS